MIQFDIGGIVEIAGCRGAFDFEDAFFGESDTAMFFVDGEVAGGSSYSPGSLPSMTSPRSRNGMMRLTR